MKKRLMLFSIVLALLASLTALAQDTTKPSDDQAKQDNTKAAQQENQEKSASQTKTVTGCLQRYDQPDQFSITGEDGKSWDLRSSAVKLADHVGHQVTVTGSSTREAKAEEKKGGQVEKAAGKEELGELRLTSLKMVPKAHVTPHDRDRLRQQQLENLGWRLIYGMLDNKPVNDYEGKLSVGSELAVSYDKIREHRKASEFGANLKRR